MEFSAVSDCRERSYLRTAGHLAKGLSGWFHLGDFRRPWSRHGDEKLLPKWLVRSRAASAARHLLPLLGGEMGGGGARERLPPLPACGTGKRRWE